MLTFRDLQLEVLRWIDEAADTDTTLALVKDGLNRSHQRLLGSRTWPFMQWAREESLTTTSGTRVYPLKHGISKILTLYDQTTGATFPLVSRREWESIGVNRVDSQSYPQGAIYGDVWPVAAQPNGSVITVASSSGSDSTSNTVVLKGTDNNGDSASETLTMNGVADVTGSVTFNTLWSVSKTGTWAGTLTVTDASDNTLLTLLASEGGKQYPTLEFIETPNSARTYLYTAQRTPAILENNGDIPDTPYPYSQLHVYDTLLDLSTYNTGEFNGQHRELWRDRYNALLGGLHDACDLSIAGSRPRFVRPMSPRRMVRRLTLS